MKRPTHKQIYEFCKDHYYCEPVTKRKVTYREKWEPFEHWSDADIEEMIDSDVTSLKHFLEVHYGK